MCTHNKLYFEKAKFETLEKLLGECIYLGSYDWKKNIKMIEKHIWFGLIGAIIQMSHCYAKSKRKVIQKGKAAGQVVHAF